MSTSNIIDLKNKYDVIIIGGGTAGLAAYRAVVENNKSALLVEKSGAIHTTCAKVGCMPSKLLIAAAKATKAVKNANNFGVDATIKQVNADQVFNRVRTERDRFVGFVEKGADNINKVYGSPIFKNKYEIEINGSIYFGDKFIIATGSSPRIPDQFNNVAGVWTSDTVFEQNVVPSSLLVVGVGVIGLEMACAFANLGSKVILVNNTQRILGLEKEIEDKVLSSLPENITYIDNAVIDNVETFEKTYNVRINKETFSFDNILIAAGRKPNIQGLGLESIFSNVDILKNIDSNSYRVSDTNLYVAGDANTLRPILHEAAMQGREAGYFASTGQGTGKNSYVPMAVVFSDPQIMWVGERLDNNVHYFGKVEFEDQGRSRVDLVNKGTLMVWFDKKNHQLKGAQMVGPDAEHIAHLLAWMQTLNVTLDTLLAMPFYHPVIQEGLRTALRDAKLKAIL